MGYAMGKKVNSKRALHECAARYKVKKQILRGERWLEGPQVIFNSLRYCVSLVHFQLTDLTRPRWESNVEKTNISLSAK